MSIEGGVPQEPTNKEILFNPETPFVVARFFANLTKMGFEEIETAIKTSELKKKNDSPLNISDLLKIQDVEITTTVIETLHEVLNVDTPKDRAEKIKRIDKII